MRGKTAAALMAAAADVRTVIANGSRPGVLGSVAAGEDVGTQILARATSASAFKLWLRYAKPVRGTLEVDAGAARALAQGGSSLLPVGVKAVHGAFVSRRRRGHHRPGRRRGRSRAHHHERPRPASRARAAYGRVAGA